ncbi:HupE/UreJ family protein [Microbacterium sp. ZW T2_14]|uniref:HupE/UreJ family protein n=1 Tax=Microbacterium sp. ZW T2_14 TaxID=3378079 RepID=UPI0038550C12
MTALIRRHRTTWIAVGIAVAAASVLLAPAAAHGHGFTTTVYVDATAPEPGVVRAEIGLEYDLLVLSASAAEDAPEFFEDGMDVFGTGEEAEALTAHADAIVDYVTQRLELTADDVPCLPERAGALRVDERHDVPYAVLTLDYGCEPAAAHELRSTLFPDEEGFVRGTVTIVDYEVDHTAGSATLTRQDPAFSTEQTLLERLGRFFVLGSEHLLFGIDHILFLLALIVGSRRLRDIVLAATAFTAAHSVTFILAALGVVSLPAALVEPLIALSIAVVGCWYLWRVWRQRREPAQLFAPTTGGGFDRTQLARFAVVFLFGLLHGVGFAGALGIHEPSSWSLLGALLVFNLGIEAVQVAIIVVTFPILLALRKAAPRTGLVVGVVIAAAVTLMGLVWFVQRLLGIG